MSNDRHILTLRSGSTNYEVEYTDGRLSVRSEHEFMDVHNSVYFDEQDTRKVLAFLIGQMSLHAVADLLDVMNGGGE